MGAKFNKFAAGHFIRFLAVSSTIAISFHSQALYAQSAPATIVPPYRITLDNDSIDIVSGTPVIDGPVLTIGSDSASSLTFSERFIAKGIGTSWLTSYGHLHNYSIALLLNSYAAGQANIILGGNSETFSISGSNYTSAGGGNLVLVSTGKWLYTSKDGTKITFTNSMLGGGAGYTDIGEVDALPTSMVLPSGEVINFTHKIMINSSIHYSRLQSVNSSSGNQLKFTYSTNDITSTSEWLKLTKVSAINNAVDYCDPAADTCSGLTVSWPSMNISFGTSGSNSTINITDANNYSYIYTLNSSGQVLSVQNPAEPLNGIDNPYNVTLNPRNSLDSYAYDGYGRVTSLTKKGIVYSYTYAATNSIKKTGPSGTVYSATVDQSKGVVLSYRDALSKLTQWTTDSKGNITSITFPELNSSTYVYDSRGNITSRTDTPKPNSGLSARTMSAGFDDSCAIETKCNKPNWTKDYLGNETDYTYDSVTGFLTSITAPADVNGIRPQTRYTYTQVQAYFKNSSGSIVASGINHTVLSATSSCLTQSGSPLSGAAGLGPFAMSGTASCVGSGDELRTAIGYGAQVAGTANNLYPLTATRASGDGLLSATTSSAYDNFGNVVALTGPLGASQKTVYYYDADRRVTAKVGPDPDGAGPQLPVMEKYLYRPLGALTMEQVGTVPSQSTLPSDPSFVELRKLTIARDVYERPVRTAIGYTSLISNSDPMAANAPVGPLHGYSVTDLLYDSSGRPSCSIQYMKLETLGSALPTSCAVTQSSGPNGPDRVSSYTYDLDDRLITTTSGVGTSASRVESTTYYDNGATATVTDGSGNMSKNFYDGFDRLSQIQYPVKTVGAASANSSDFESFTYDANDNVLVHRVRDGGTFTSAYDNLGRVLSITPGGSSLQYPADYPINYAYNLAGAVKSISRPGDSTAITYTYDGLRRLTAETQPNGTMSYQYDLADNRTRLTWHDGFYASYAYDLTGKVLSIGENGATSGIGLLASYTYDSFNRRVGVAFGNGTSNTFAYDALDRLAGKALTFPSASNNYVIGAANGVGTALSYNPASQVSGFYRSNSAYLWAGNSILSRNYTVNGLNQYTGAGSTTFGYDARGNLTSSAVDGVTTAFSYSKANQLISSGSVAMTYDPAGRLSVYNSSSGGANFYYAGDQLVAERSGSAGAILRRYVPGPGLDEPIVWYEGAGTTDRRTLQSDERGSIVAVSDASGNLLHANTYDEFGIPASGNIGRFGFTGQTWFPEVGLYNYKARWYSPTLGRFMQTDLIGYGDGLNWYNYSHGDPLNGIDPSGLDDYSNESMNNINGAQSSGPPITVCGGVSFDGGCHSWAYVNQYMNQINQYRPGISLTPPPHSPCMICRLPGQPPYVPQSNQQQHKPGDCYSYDSQGRCTQRWGRNGQLELDPDYANRACSAYKNAMATLSRVAQFAAYPGAGGSIAGPIVRGKVGSAVTWAGAWIAVVGLTAQLQIDLSSPPPGCN